MRIAIDQEVQDDLEGLTGKKLTKNGNSVIAEVVEMAKDSQDPESVDISCCPRTDKLASESGEDEP